MSFTIKKPTMKLPIYWIYILFLLPPFLLNRSDLSIICDLWHLAQLVIVCVMSLYYFVNYRARNTIVNAVLCYYIVAIISSYLNGYSINTIKWDIASDLGIVLVIYLLFNKNKEKEPQPRERCYGSCFWFVHFCDFLKTVKNIEK